MEIKNLLQKRVLYKYGLVSSITEGEVLEISPSGKYVKISLIKTDNTVWEEADRIIILEVLGDSKNK